MPNGMVAGETVCATPPATSSRLMLASTVVKNAIDRPSGENAGTTARSVFTVPGSGLTSNDDSDRR
jgi:hypothetical protein